jgi:hypothetical protein
MKTIAISLIYCLLLVSCLKKVVSIEVNQVKERQGILSKEILTLETQKPDTSYVFNIESFMYLDEFPKTSAGVKEQYFDEIFEEKTQESWVMSTPSGKYVFSLNSPNIQFGFWGDTLEDAILRTVEILNSQYQCEAIQIIGMPIEELERVSNKKLTNNNIVIINEFEIGLIIRTKDGIVKNYLIID